MNTKEIEKILIQGGIEPNEAKIEAKILIKHFFGVNDVDLVLEKEFDESRREDLLLAANLRAQKRIPIQHILGTAYFMGEDFIVNEHVLIPRDETELLVKQAVEIIKSKQICRCEEYSDEAIQNNIKVLDIGTGSGCIACMIAKLSGAQVIGVDISREALGVALDNSSKLGLFNKAIFRKSDIFSNVKVDEKFDLIVSNPPYIPKSEKEKLQKEVGFEPDIALFADNNGLDFYQKISKQSPKFLKNGGYLIFELGVGQSQEVFKLMSEAGFKEIEIQKDLAQIDRVIWGRI
ncbi:MAG TPA: peptide chain release factor N(5)-glutamine methyltransferase [Candidatus Gastranaerophilaceae bacterium]|nr:peptide chain release factor N(5)-glutamine methyltransferase [Candidatus Gastranaerophilaceae bacterium]HPT41596.1 peptide chain release factor N(5)-glutamine methyltransferase [Candidatus Gastranaerophilaceae bacterium]